MQVAGKNWCGGGGGGIDEGVVDNNWLAGGGIIGCRMWGISCLQYLLLLQIPTSISAPEE